jgi:hypothetical protein
MTDQELEDELLSHGLHHTEVPAAAAAYRQLKRTYNFDFDYDYDIDFCEFHCFARNIASYCSPVWTINNNGYTSHLCFTSVSSGTGSGRSADLQVWGVVKLKKNYGHLLIKNETLLDKVHDLIKPIDIDFKEDKTFSKRFLVVSNDEMQARLLLNDSFRMHVSNLQTKEISIEIKGYDLIIGNEKGIEVSTATDIVRFIHAVAGIY